MNSHGEGAKRGALPFGRFKIASCIRDEISRGPALARRFLETTPMLDYFIAE
jgi:hypothetical protein